MQSIFSLIAQCVGTFGLHKNLGDARELTVWRVSIGSDFASPLSRMSYKVKISLVGAVGSSFKRPLDRFLDLRDYEYC